MYNVTILRATGPLVTTRHTQGYLEPNSHLVLGWYLTLPDEHVCSDGEEDVAVDQETQDTADDGEGDEGPAGLDGEVHQDDHPDGEEQDGQGSH